MPIKHSSWSNDSHGRKNRRLLERRGCQGNLGRERDKEPVCAGERGKEPACAYQGMGEPWAQVELVKFKDVRAAPAAQLLREGKQPAHSKSQAASCPNPCSVMPKSTATKEITTEGSETSRALRSRPVAVTEGDGGL